MAGTNQTEGQLLGWRGLSSILWKKKGMYPRDNPIKLSFFPPPAAVFGLKLNLVLVLTLKENTHLSAARVLNHAAH